MNNWFDIIVLVILVIAFFKGIKKGVIRMLVELSIIVVATIFGGKLASNILPELEKITNLSDQWTSVVSYVIAFAIIAVALTLIGNIIQKLINLVSLTFINRIAGGIISMSISVILISILINIILIIDINKDIFKPDMISKSFFFDRVQSVVPAITPYLDNEEIEKFIPEKYIREIEHSNSNGKIDSTFQRQYFETDSL